jgi:hypothetical protein
LRPEREQTQRILFHTTSTKVTTERDGLKSSPL